MTDNTKRNNTVFSPNNMTAKITAYCIEKDEKNKDYVAYLIHCRLKRSVTWTVMKRYSDCHAFHKRLSSTLVSKSVKIPFPGKMLRGNFDTKNIEKRLSELQAWFDQITTASSVWFTNYEALIHEFLDTEKNIALHVSNKCNVDLGIAEHFISQYSNYIGAIPDYERAIDSILNERTFRIMDRTGQDYERARKALDIVMMQAQQLEEVIDAEEAAVAYIMDVQSILDNSPDPVAAKQAQSEERETMTEQINLVEEPVVLQQTVEQIVHEMVDQIVKSIQLKEDASDISRSDVVKCPPSPVRESTEPLSQSPSRVGLSIAERKKAILSTMTRTSSLSNSPSSPINFGDLTRVADNVSLNVFFEEEENQIVPLKARQSIRLQSHQVVLPNVNNDI